jgi:hypothetical protein
MLKKPLATGQDGNSRTYNSCLLEKKQYTQGGGRRLLLNGVVYRSNRIISYHIVCRITVTVQDRNQKRALRTTFCKGLPTSGAGNQNFGTVNRTEETGSRLSSSSGLGRDGRDESLAEGSIQYSTVHSRTCSSFSRQDGPDLVSSSKEFDHRG